MKLSADECKMILAISPTCYTCKKEGDAQGYGFTVNSCGCWRHYNCSRHHDCDLSKQQEMVVAFLKKRFTFNDGSKAALRAFFRKYCPNFGASLDDYEARGKEVERLQKELEKLHREKLSSWSTDLHTRVDDVLQQIEEMNERAASEKLASVKLEQSEADIGQLMKDNQDLVIKCERALATARSKSVQLETVTREIAQLKEEYKTVQKDVPEELVAKKEEQFCDPDWHSSDDALLTTQWNEFRTKFNTLHKNVKDILQSSVSAKDAFVLCANLTNVRELTEVAETVREELMKSTEDCTEKIANILDRILPASSSATGQESRPSDAQLLE